MGHSCFPMPSHQHNGWRTFIGTGNKVCLVPRDSMFSYVYLYLILFSKFSTEAPVTFIASKKGLQSAKHPALRSLQKVLEQACLVGLLIPSSAVQSGSVTFSYSTRQLLLSSACPPRSLTSPWQLSSRSQQHGLRPHTMGMLTMVLLLLGPPRAPVP